MNDFFIVCLFDGQYKELNFRTGETILSPVRFLFHKKAYISLMENARFMDGTKVKPMEEGHYEIENGDYSRIELFVYGNVPIKKWGMYQLKEELFSKDGLTISNPFFEDSISIQKNLLMADSNYVFVNDRRVQGELLLKNGDRICILSTEVIYYQNFISVNGLFIVNRLNKYVPDYPLFQYSFPSLKDNPVLLNPTLEIKEIKPFFFEYKDKTVSHQQLIPSIVMTLTMSLMAFLNILNGIENNVSRYQLIVMALMPMGMLITMILYPLFMNIWNKGKEKKAREKAIQEYLNVLEQYRMDLISKRKQYLEEIKPFFFMDPEYRPVFLHKRSSLYSSISLGYSDMENAQSLLISEEERINGKLKEIEGIFHEKVPVFLRLMDYHNVIVIEKEKYLRSRFLTVIRELSEKHSSKDLKFIVYSQKKEDFRPLLSLPHLYHSGMRMTFSDERKLLEVDSLSFKEDVILFALSPLPEFRNSHIHCVQFISENDPIPEGELLIDFASKQCRAGERNFDSCFYMDETDWISSKESIPSSLQKRSYGFHDFFSFEKEDILRNYKEKRRDLTSLFAYDNTNLFSLNLHEQGDGPHGIIGGTTGSGKSELLISLLLSLMSRYSSEYLQMIIVDYKGGGIAESFRYEGKLPPHIMATLDNLENSSFERLLLKISFLLKERQLLFKQLSKEKHKPITSIDDCLEYKAVPHLLIVVDEFAELKKEQPAFMKELISYARIGRSLGIHLLLLTQKPSTSIDEEILSNCSFRIALKTSDSKDSREIIDSDKASQLKEPGEFYCLSNNHLRYGKTFYSRRDYFNGEKKKVTLLDENLLPIKEKEFSKEETISECQMAIRNILSVSEELGLKRNILEFERREEKSSTALKREYRYTGDDWILGETDDYLHDHRELLVHSLNENALILSTRKDELFHLLNTIGNKNTVVIAKRKLKYYEAIDPTNEEDIEFLFEKLLTEKKEIRLVIENLDRLLCSIETGSEYLYRILRKRNVKVFALSKDSEINTRILLSFEKRYMISTPDKRKTSEFFMEKPHSLSDSYFYRDELIGFVPVKEEKLKEVSESFSYMEYIPEIIRKEKGLVGYELQSRKKIYTDKKIRIISMNNKSLEEIKDYYDEDFFEFHVYENEGSLNTPILFVGKGIRNTRYFVPRDYQYRENTGLFYQSGEILKVKLVNHA